jgi:hypothetical protein
MEIKDYCKNVDIELTSWKAKLYDVIRRLDAMPSGHKEKVLPELEGLQIIVTELDERIDQLRTSCPTEWAPEKSEIKGKIADLEEQYNEINFFY